MNLIHFITLIPMLSFILGIGCGYTPLYASNNNLLLDCSDLIAQQQTKKRKRVKKKAPPTPMYDESFDTTLTDETSYSSNTINSLTLGIDLAQLFDNRYTGTISYLHYPNSTFGGGRIGYGGFFLYSKYSKDSVSSTTMAVGLSGLFRYIVNPTITFYGGLNLGLYTKNDYSVKGTTVNTNTTLEDILNEYNNEEDYYINKTSSHISSQLAEESDGDIDINPALRLGLMYKMSDTVWLTLEYLAGNLVGKAMLNFGVAFDF